VQTGAQCLDYTSLFARKAAETSEKSARHTTTTTTKNTVKAGELVNSVTTFIYVRTQKKHLLTSVKEVRFSRRGAIQIYIRLRLPLPLLCELSLKITQLYIVYVYYSYK